MKLTKTEIEILKLFTSKITYSFSIREVSREIKKDLKIVHTSIKNLLKNNFFIKDKRLSLNYKKNIPDLSYVENIRKEIFFQKFHFIRIKTNEFLEKTKHSFFILLVFGSYVEENHRKNSDIDILAILPREDKNESFERELNSIFSLSPKKVHLNVITREDFREMLNKRDQLNVVNETINRHIILYGGETYYKLLGDRSVR
tara:strand:- start:54 stop:656 length:603 start_codon:yes stop_codon:yes gene_type:complete